MVSTKKVCRSSQSMFFTYYTKTISNVLADQPAEKKILSKVKQCGKEYFFWYQDFDS